MWPAIIAAVAAVGSKAVTQPTNATKMVGNSDPMFGSLLTNMDTSGWTVNFGDGATQTATTGDRGGQTLSAEQTKVAPIPSNTASASASPYYQPQGQGQAGAGYMQAGAGSGAAIPWNLVLMFGGAAALILLWKR